MHQTSRTVLCVMDKNNAQCSSLYPLNAKLNNICHFLVLLGAHHIFHVSRIKVNRLNTIIVMYNIKVSLCLQITHITALYCVTQSKCHFFHKRFVHQPQEEGKLNDIMRSLTICTPHQIFFG